MVKVKTITVTYRYRIKGRSAVRYLTRLSKAVNQVWNYCNATCYHAIRDHGKFLSKYDLNTLVGGSSKELGLHSQTVQGIAEEFSTRKKQFKKRKLKWRVSKGLKKSLGWIPFKKSGITIEDNKVTYCGREIKFIKHRDIPPSIPQCGSFSEDAMGNWYANFVVKVPVIETQHEVLEVGGDIGLKDIMVLSDGVRVENPRVFSEHEEKLAGFQRHHKKKQARRLSARIRNIRKDFIHKKTLSLVKKYRTLFVGDVSGKWLQATKGKSSQDASTGAFRTILRYKAIRHQGSVVDVSEKSTASTITCSSCLKKTGPSGLSGLGVREWECRECKAVHNRDVNSAINHLRAGSGSLKPLIAA